MPFSTDRTTDARIRKIWPTATRIEPLQDDPQWVRIVVNGSPLVVSAATGQPRSGDLSCTNLAMRAGTR